MIKGIKMIDGAWLAATLEETPSKIIAWKGQASQLDHLVQAAQITGGVSDELLTVTERTASSIYAEISKCAEVIANVAAASPEAASQLASLNDALHLVLLEITELSTKLYAVRSTITKLAADTLA